MFLLWPRTVRSAVVATALTWVSAPFALADDYAYMGGGNRDFGVIDLTTGVFTSCGQSPALLSGFGVGPDLKIYGGAFRGTTLYRVNRANGALIAIGNSHIEYLGTGSTTVGVYALGADGNIYSIDTMTAEATRIGPIGIPINTGWWGFSTNASALYYTHNSTLYRINLRTGAATLIGTASSGLFGAEVFEGGRLYAGNESPLSVVALNRTTGVANFVSNVIGTTSTFWGLVPITATAIADKDICAPHKI